MIGIVVIRIHDPNTKRRGISERTVVDAIDIQVLHDREIAVDSQNRVDALEVLVERRHLHSVIDDGLPEGLPPLFIMKRCTFGKPAQPLIRYRNIAFTAEPAKISS